MGILSFSDATAGTLLLFSNIDPSCPGLVGILAAHIDPSCPGLVGILAAHTDVGPRRRTIGQQP